MPDQSNGYQLPSWPPTKIDRALWNGVMANLDARLKAREALEATFEILQEQGVQAALDYIQVSVAPQLSALQQSIANAQAVIDDILAGTAPNAAKLGGQLPSYYAKAQATAEALGALAVDISLLNTAIGKKLNKAGDSMSWILKLAFDYPQLWWGDAATGTGWRIIKDTPEGQVGSLVFQCSTDRWAGGANMKTAMSLGADGKSILYDLWAVTQLRVPNFEDGGQFNGFLKGNGDGASFNTYNFSLSGWWGMAMRTYDGSINGYYDFRSGTWDVKGGFKVNGNYVPHAGNKASSSEIASGVQNKFPDAAAVKDYMANNVPPSLGIGQSWQDVQANRQAGVAYQNTTGRTIVVSPGGSARNSFCEGQVSVDGTNWLTPNRGEAIYTSDTRYYYAYPIFEVPPNHYYRLTVGSNYLGLTKWLELR